jgi:transposase-like protein
MEPKNKMRGTVEEGEVGSVAEVSPAGVYPSPVPDPAVPEKPQRRRFTTEYKLQIIREADACKRPGELGALLRREGLYSSYLVTWRQQRDRAAQTGISASKRGPKAKVVDPRMKQLERENANLKRRIKRMDLLLEIQKKTSELLGIPLNHLDEDEND